ncbi:hypothetical protein [Robinsoniella peoriensis]|nr:hypothetical protein [Robinsoniella peoriensis]
MINLLKKSFFKCRVLQNRTSAQSYTIPREDLQVMIHTNVITYIVQKL